MLLKFVLEHTQVPSVREYVHRQVTTNSLAFQKHEKHFLEFIVANWRDNGKRFLNEAVRTIALMKVLLSVSRLLPKKQLETFFEWLPALPVADTTPADLLEELVKFNFVLVSDVQTTITPGYLIYVSGLLRITLRPTNTLPLHECSLNLLSVLLLHDNFKAGYLAEFK